MDLKGRFTPVSDKIVVCLRGAFGLGDGANGAYARQKTLGNDGAIDAGASSQAGHRQVRYADVSHASHNGHS